MFLVLHHQNFVRYLFPRQEDELRDVRSGNLHFLDFIKVRARSLEVLCLSHLTSLLGLLGRIVIRETIPLPTGRQCY